MNELLEKDRKYVWHPFTQMLTAETPLLIEKASGSWLYATDGKKYLDCNSSWWVNVHGHGNERIAKALSDQFGLLDHVMFAGITHPKAIELAERIVKCLPEILSKVFFSDNGSTAIEVSLKMVFQYWFNLNKPRKRILALEGAYHGDTFGAMAVGQRGYFNEPFEHLFFDVDYLAFPTKETESDLLDQAENLFQSGEFAAVILEPLIQGSAGMRTYSSAWLDCLMDLAQKHNVLIIFDEVMTAWGRTGKYFALEHCRNKPDIVCLSKGLTGGTLPLGLTVATDKIYDAFLSKDKLKALLHGHSFTGNALACAVACASLDIFEESDTWAKIESISITQKQWIDTLVGHPKLCDVRQLGTIAAIEIKTGEGNTYFSSIRDTAYNYFIENGFLIRPLGNVIFLNPPYSTTIAELKSMHRIIEKFLSELS
jgi:adenosylmethionine---8-amino-7-oxononanoate aminotransferase